MANLLEERLGGKQQDNDAAPLRKKVKKKEKLVKLQELEIPEFNEEQFEFEQELLENEKVKKLKAHKKYDATLNKIAKGALLLLMLYIIFLIYGVMVTEYTYNDKGEVVPIVFTVDEIRELREFETLSVHYKNIRDLYEQIIVLDYRLSLGNENYTLLAAEYETLLETVNMIVVQMEAYAPPSRYNQAYLIMQQTIKTDIAVYLQNISAALAQDNADKAQKAIISKEVVYNDFTKATEIIISLGKNVRGVNISEFEDWSVEKSRIKNIGSIENVG